MSRFHDDMTLSEARAVLRELVDEGHKCPLCTQFAKVYKRKLNHRHVRTAITMLRAFGTNWGRPADADGRLAGDGGGISYLRFFGLAEEHPDPPTDNNRSGVWRLTEKGERWVRGDETIPKYARVYDARVLGFEGPEVAVVESLGKRFNYHELMAGV